MMAVNLLEMGERFQAEGRVSAKALRTEPEHATFEEVIRGRVRELGEEAKSIERQDGREPHWAGPRAPRSWFWTYPMSHRKVLETFRQKRLDLICVKKRSL